MKMSSLQEGESVSTNETDNNITNSQPAEKNTEKVTSFVDIKSEGLRDVLRVVLEGVHGISLREDMPTVFRCLHMAEQS